MSSPQLTAEDPTRAFARARGYAALLWLLSFLFALRMLGQALQHWAPQPYLPPFNAFQGSNLPYWLLLSAQLVILVLMARFAWRVQAGSLVPGRCAASVLAWVGWIYMAGSLGRIAVGLVVPAAPAWFTTCISAVFHVVLAGYVLTLAYYHRHQFRSAYRKGEE
jgi:hypothetical protein